MLGLGLLSDFYFRAKIPARRKVLWLNRTLLGKRHPIARGFFDDYPLFFSTSKISGGPNRLNQRYRACIEWNDVAIRGKRILDIASHDGRWSFAALKAGASHVIGIEARDYLVQSANSNLLKYEIPPSCFRFISGDAFDCMDRIEPGSIDAVFCLGFFYHTSHHTLLLSKIAKLKVKYLILDTAIYEDPYRVIDLYGDDGLTESMAARVGIDTTPLILEGSPSKSALEYMLTAFGWSFVYYDWHRVGIRRWDEMIDYHG